MSAVESTAGSLDANELAMLRTRAALDRTLLAWIRTAFALQGFGFSLATYVTRWIASGALHGVSPDVPRRLGLTLVALGTVGLFGGAVDYHRAAKHFRRVGGWDARSVVLPIAVLMVVISIFMFIGALERSAAG